MPRIAIIGAGLAGVTLAHRLRGRAEIVLVEKSRGVAGRMSTRRQDDFTFDHGAQYFTIRDQAFAEVLAPLIRDGVVAQWRTRFATAAADGGLEDRAMASPPMVATPSMTGLVKALAGELDLRLGAEAARLEEHPEGWRVVDADGDEIIEADWLVTAVPAPQARRLLPADHVFGPRLDGVVMKGCFTFMLGFEGQVDLPWGAVFPQDSLLGFVADNSTRPGRGGATALTVQTTNAWAEPRLDDDREAVEAAITGALRDQLGIDAGKAVYRRLHRWRYAAVATPLGEDCLVDPASRTAAMGDWCIGSRVEAAFRSADSLARRFETILD